MMGWRVVGSVIPTLAALGLSLASASAEQPELAPLPADARDWRERAYSQVDACIEDGVSPKTCCARADLPAAYCAVDAYPDFIEEEDYDMLDVEPFEPEIAPAPRKVARPGCDFSEPLGPFSDERRAPDDETDSYYIPTLRELAEGILDGARRQGAPPRQSRRQSARLDEARTAAQDGMKTFRGIMENPQFREALLIPASVDLSRARPVEPLGARMIGLGDFVKFADCAAPADDFANIFRPTAEHLFAIEAAGVKVATVRVAELDGAPEPVEFGLPVLTAQIETARRFAAETFGADPALMEYVEFPAMNVEFLHFRCNGASFLTPLGDERPEFRTGRAYRYGYVRRALAEAARRRGGAPD